MNRLEKLEDKLHNNNIDIYDVETTAITAAAIQLGGKQAIIIDKNKIRNRTHEHTVLAHEFCHIETGTLYTFNDDKIIQDKKEYKCNKYMIQKLVPIEKFKDLLTKGYQKHEIAFIFEVTEEMIDLAIKIYKATGEL